MPLSYRLDHSEIHIKLAFDILSVVANISVVAKASEGLRKRDMYSLSEAAME